MKIAVIDFSSTSLSLLVEEVSGEMATPLVGLRRSVSILGYLSKKGKLSKRGIEKVVEGIKFLEEAAVNVGAESVSLISTASMRIIRNYPEVVDAIYAGTNLEIYNLDGQSEAYAGYVANREYSALGRTLLIDIGGYNISLVDMDDGKKEDMFALDIGPAALYKGFEGVYPDKDDEKKIRKVIRRKLEKAGCFPGKTFAHIVLTGSNSDALYSVYADRFSVAETSFRMIERKKLKKLSKYLITSKDRAALLIRNAPEKVHMLIPAAILADEIAAIFDSPELIVSDKGVKEGYLRLLVEGKNA